MFLRKKHFNSHFFVNNCIPTITGKVTFFSLVEIFSTSEKKKRYLIELISSHKNWVKKKNTPEWKFWKKYATNSVTKSDTRIWWNMSISYFVKF